MEITTGKPYKQITLGKYKLRYFPATTKENDLVWHRDHYDRMCIPLLNRGNWLFQYDDELPFVMDTSIFIPNGVYHRVIRGAVSSFLVVLIIEKR